MKKCADARASFRKTSAFEGKAKPATSRWFPPLQQPHGPTKRLIADKSEGPVFVMTVYECRCGFASGTAVGFQRHIARYKGETGKHRMVSKTKVAGKDPSTPANEADAQTTVEASRPSERSWLSGLWSSDANSQSSGQPEEGPQTAKAVSDRTGHDDQEVIEQSNASRIGHDDEEVIEQNDTSKGDMLEPSSSGGESTWEKVSSFVDSGEEEPYSKDEYAALTAQLAASGPAAGTRAKTRRPASAGRRSKLAPQSEQDTQAAQAPAPAAADPASPSPASAAAAAAAPASNSDATKPSSETRHDSAPAAEDMERAASASTASPARMDSSHPQPQSIQDSDRQAAASPVATANTVLHPDQPSEPCVSGDQLAEGRQSAEASTSSPAPPVRSASPVQQDEGHQRGRQIVRKSIGMVNWLKASTDAALALQPASAQSIHALEQKNTCSADDVQAVLLWREPMQTGKVFLAGMYILVCLRQLVSGVELLQPSTAIAGLLLALLLGNTVRCAIMPASDRRLPRRELALQAQIAQAVSRRGTQLASVVGAIVVLMHRRLSGHDRTGTTVWLALTLWTIMALGEAALLSQSSMSMAVWCAIFGLPSLYLQCRHILDVLVEEALQLVAAFLRAGQRGTVMFAAGAGLVVLMAVPLSLFARLSLAVLTVGNVIFWKACMPSTRPGRSFA